MKKTILTLISIMLVISGCNADKENANIDTTEEIKIEYTIPENYNLDNAEKDGYVKYLENEIINEDKIQGFYDKSKNDKDCSITIFKLTIEGNYIVEQYYYSNHRYTLFIDNTRDNSDNPKIEKKEIKDIEITKDSGHIILNPIY